MADLVLEKDTPITHLAWVDDVAPRWEPEPVRWLGAKAMEFFGDRADTQEFATGSASKFWGRLFDRFTR